MDCKPAHGNRDIWEIYEINVDIMGYLWHIHGPIIPSPTVQKIMVYIYISGDEFIWKRWFQWDFFMVP